MDFAFYTPSTLTSEEADRLDRVHGALTAATRALADAQLRTQVELDEAEAVTAEVERLTERLLTRAQEGSLGTELGPRENEIRNQGNAVLGLRNPFAAFSEERRTIDDEGRVVYDVELGALYEGPPGLVHGGVSAMLLDQLLGEATARAGGPGMTGRLTVHYRRPTPLGKLRFRGWSESIQGRKSIAKGDVLDPDGNVTVEAEGLFILPSWALEHPSWTDRKSSFE
ncbi:PaaI family thioesterase [Nocardioides caldifontis]|uniref:PaaI family thioesterase n=1 Tax=Nocardioides caldifontis TaxID=2588938 RepID=UPI0011DF2485|nr:PaaI family thioesterase [Nocardioides caldifontis]